MCDCVCMDKWECDCKVLGVFKKGRKVLNTVNMCHFCTLVLCVFTTILKLSNTFGYKLNLSNNPQIILLLFKCIFKLPGALQLKRYD